MVSNNPYTLRASLDVSQRRRLDSGRLGVFAVTARTGAEAAEVLTMSLAGHGAKSHRGFEFSTERFEINSRSGVAFAGIDGEALTLDTPLSFQVHPRGLRMLVPEGNLESALRRRAREVRLRDLPAIAMGAMPSSGR
jgi:diacylglycerol kinase family enzyme